jgi:cyclase
MLRKISLIACALTLTALAQPGGGKGGGPQPQSTKQVKPGLYIVTGAGANSLVRVTNEGVILMDAKLPGDQNYAGLMEQIKSVTDKPVKYLIVTHHHADHTGNNAKFLEAGVPIVAQTNLNKNLETYKFDPRPAPATILYDKDHVIRLAGVEVQVHHYGRSHTGGDSVVYYPDLKVVAVSDAVTTSPGTGPLVDYAGGGSATEWQTVLDSILKLDFDTCVPGSGPILTKADVQTFKTKFDTMINRAKELVRNGVAKDQLLAQLKTDDLGWTPRIPDASAFYDEISKAK